MEIGNRFLRVNYEYDVWESHMILGVSLRLGLGYNAVSGQEKIAQVYIHSGNSGQAISC